ncbi:MAG: ADP-forming succinate--CoA ligase subunit beta [Candidatus Sumerlaeia bacterium]|nr:ADP-forming succinate--CoA ligase subunit beta [Candidatus Sumerlaeia bacterium]
MNIHEYQAKELLAGYGVPTPKGKVANSVEEAVAIAGDLMCWPLVVKAQVHTGGRGKAGGVKVVKDLESLKAATKAILGLDINGHTVHKVLIEPGVDIKQEIYLGVILDRASQRPIMMASAEGGVEIEVLAEERPEAILKLPIPPTYGVRPHHMRQVASFLGIPQTAMKSFTQIFNGLTKSFYEKDMSLAEVNPLVITGAGDAIACDAKINFDDNALPRHPDVESLRDNNEEEPLEVEAREKSLNYVKLDGKIGCIVNGAGLAMGTMDIVKHFGGEPANFLDIGGGAKAQQVAEALQLITSDPAVNTIFFNIFGGIVRCDLVAEGILTALSQLPDFDYPIVIRLSGTNEEKARQMLENTDLHIAETMSDGARKAVELSNR